MWWDGGPHSSNNTAVKNEEGNGEHVFFPGLTFHFLQVLWMTAAALFHLWTCFLTSQARTAAGKRHSQPLLLDVSYLANYAIFCIIFQIGYIQQTYKLGTRPRCFADLTKKNSNVTCLDQSGRLSTGEAFTALVTQPAALNGEGTP